MLPEDFAYVRDIIPDAFEDIRYAGSHNFMGRPACGYGAARAVLTLPAALALKKAAAHFGSKGLRLLIYDAYRRSARWMISSSGRRLKTIPSVRPNFIRRWKKRSFFRADILRGAPAIRAAQPLI